MHISRIAWGGLGIAVCCMLACAPTKQIVKSDTWMQVTPLPTLTPTPPPVTTPVETQTYTPTPTVTPAPGKNQHGQNGRHKHANATSQTVGGSNQSVVHVSGDKDLFRIEPTAVIVSENSTPPQAIGSQPTPGSFWTPTPIPAMQAGNDGSGLVGQAGEPSGGSRSGISVTRFFVGAGLFLLITGIVFWFKQTRERQPRSSDRLARSSEERSATESVTPARSSEIPMHKVAPQSSSDLETMTNAEPVAAVNKETELPESVVKTKTRRKTVTTTVKVQKTVKTQMAIRKAPKKAALRIGRATVKTVRLDAEHGSTKRKRRSAA